MNQSQLQDLLATHANAKGNNELFNLRLYSNASILKDLFFALYPETLHAETYKILLQKLRQLYHARPTHLKEQDAERMKKIDWYQSQELVGMQLYVDLFNKNLKGVQSKLPYFESLGVNFVHLMPITTRPSKENDGGYAVNSYTEIDPKLGTKEDLAALTKELRKRNMFLMLDFVANHTSDEHEWATKAKMGDATYKSFFYTFPDRRIPDAFEEHMQEVFPETAPGNFTFIPEMNSWVMTVFNTYQWDLNYQNPKVFLAMLENLVELSNMGADVIRLDALAFLWKKLKTNSQNLPEAHKLISLFKLCLQVVAPGSIILAEAIVAPEEIVKYFGEGNRKGNECELAYNASLMALLWDAIATKKTNLLYKSLFNLPHKPATASWINYIRCHDDIGLGISDQYIRELGLHPQSHRSFLLDYYCQGLDWSPAKGLVFMYNPKTKDGRISGSTASLLGLEKGLETKDPQMIEHALLKISMLHGIILSFGGVPMIYAGDEIGALNDYSFLKSTEKKEDNRWVNRPKRNWKSKEDYTDASSIAGGIFHKLQTLISIRKREVAFADKENIVLHDTLNPHIFIYERNAENNNGVLVICNFDEHEQRIESGFLNQLGYSFHNKVFDIIEDQRISFKKKHLVVRPYQLLWLKKIDQL